LTQSDLAEGIVTPSMISLIESERANPSEKVLRALSERLSVPYEEIISGETSDWEAASTVLIFQAYLMNGETEAAKDFLNSLPDASTIPGYLRELLLVDCCRAEGKNAEALEKLIQMEDIHQGNSSGIFAVWKRMAQLYAVTGDEDLAYHYWKKAFQVSIQDPSSELCDILDCVSQMCFYLLEKEQIDEIRQILLELKKYRNIPQEISELAKTYLDAAVSFRSKKRYRDSSIMAHRAFTLTETVLLFQSLDQLKIFEAIAENSLSSLPVSPPKGGHRLLAEYHLRNGNLESADEHARLLVSEADSVHQKANALSVLAKVLAAKKDYLQAAETIKRQISIWEQLGNAEKVAKSYSRLTHILLRAYDHL
jgi:transcriptional regulator with XRE-family HTH domain